MSYQGFEVWLCRNGHQHNFDAYDVPNTHDWLCPFCGEPVCWVELVDQTNNEGVVTVLVEYEPMVVTACKHCQHMKDVKPARFYVPENHAPLYAPPLVPTRPARWTVWGQPDRDFASEDEAVAWLEGPRKGEL